MARVQVWHNPTCSKCATALEVVQTAGFDYELRDYQRTPPSVAELEGLLDKLGLAPVDITRFTEPAAQLLGLTPDAALSRRAWLECLVAHPQLIQRPIVVFGDGTAIMGRDPEELQRSLALRAPGA